MFLLKNLKTTVKNSLRNFKERGGRKFKKNGRICGKDRRRNWRNLQGIMKETQKKLGDHCGKDLGI